MNRFAALLLLCISTASHAQCALPQQDGTLIFTADTAANCTGYWLIPASEYSAYLSSVEITASEVTEAFTWGFGTVILLSGLAFKVALGRNLVRKI
jgi:hypothetical protein